MTVPQRRKYFQIHLSTAIVMMFVGGGLTWANVNVYRLSLNNRLIQNADLVVDGNAVGEAEYIKNFCAKFWNSNITYEYGWPQVVLQNYWQYGPVVDDKIISQNLIETKCNARGICVNSLFALIILLIVAIILEWSIRRREPRFPRR